MARIHFFNCGFGVLGEKRAYASGANTRFVNAVKIAGYIVNYTVHFETNGGGAIPDIT